MYARNIQLILLDHVSFFLKLVSKLYKTMNLKTVKLLFLICKFLFLKTETDIKLKYFYLRLSSNKIGTI